MRDRRLVRAAIKDRLYRRRFLLPNAVTLANMFCGFLACIYSAQGHFDKAAIAIGFAILLDGLDGRVARKFNATSKFGVEFDSFSDLASFGIAPAIMVYHWALEPIANDFGVFVCFIYAVCAASRLARFNISVENLKTFTGLPTPGAAAFVASAVNFFTVPEPSVSFAIFGGATMLLLGFLMVSTIEFFSVKTVRMRALGIFPRILVAAAIGLVWYNSAIGFLALSSAYILSGPYGILKKRYFAPRGSERSAVAGPALGEGGDSKRTAAEDGDDSHSFLN